MEDNGEKRKRLTKKPPSQKNSAYDNASNSSSGSLSRDNKLVPSKSTHTPSNPSNSSLNRQSLQYSPNLGGSEAFAKRYSNPLLRPLSGQTPEEFVGAPFSFDVNQIESQIDANRALGYQNSLRRPPPPPLSYTSPPETRIMSPKLRQTASFSADTEKPARVGDNKLIIPKRYSDEREPKSAVLKKKGFSGFMSGLVGSPRRVNISAPENPVHVTHVGYDSNTGQFTVWKNCFAIV